MAAPRDTRAVTSGSEGDAGGAEPVGKTGWEAAAAAGAPAWALLSGGLDSGVALALWLRAGGTCAGALTANYGQRAAVREAEAAQGLARRLGVPWRGLDLGWLAGPSRSSGSALVDGSRDLPTAEPSAPGDAATAAAVWVPARNVVLCAAAAAFADAAGVGWILTGFNAEEAVTFADNSPAFVAAVDGLLRWGCRAPVRLASPTLHLAKPAIVAAARTLGFGPGDFWSCYEGGIRPCQRCESCARAARAWQPA